MDDPFIAYRQKSLLGDLTQHKTVYFSAVFSLSSLKYIHSFELSYLVISH